jgi:NOL1/NOP2/fmu family ribosome biogenesis protein
MTKISFLDNTKKKKLVKQLNEQLGISKIPYLLIKSGKDKVRAFSGSLSKEEINEIENEIRIELIGSRIINTNKDDIRISFDAISLPEVKSQINKNVIKINDEQAESWMKGEDLEMEVKTKARYIAIKHKNDILGLGRVQEGKIKNYVPKERRVR